MIFKTELTRGNEDIPIEAYISSDSEKVWIEECDDVYGNKIILTDDEERRILRNYMQGLPKYDQWDDPRIP